MNPVSQILLSMLMPQAAAGDNLAATTVPGANFADFLIAVPTADASTVVTGDAVQADAASLAIQSVTPAASLAQQLQAQATITSDTLTTEIPVVPEVVPVAAVAAPVTDIATEIAEGSETLLNIATDTASADTDSDDDKKDGTDLIAVAALLPAQNPIEQQVTAPTKDILTAATKPVVATPETPAEPQFNAEPVAVEDAPELPANTQDQAKAAPVAIANENSKEAEITDTQILNMLAQASGKQPKPAAKTQVLAEGEGNQPDPISKVSDTEQVAAAQLTPKLKTEKTEINTQVQPAENQETQGSDVQDPEISIHGRPVAELQAETRGAGSAPNSSTTDALNAASNQRHVNPQQHINAPKVHHINITPEAANVTEQVTMKISNGANGLEKITVVLEPAELGKVDIAMKFDGEGQTNVQITADRADTLQLLKSEAKELQRALMEAGVKAEPGSLSFNLRGDGNPQGQGKGFDLGGQNTQQQNGQNQQNGDLARKLQDTGNEKTISLSLSNMNSDSVDLKV